MISHLDFEQTVKHLHGLLGRHVSVSFENYELASRESFAGFNGTLGHAQKPELAELQAASGHGRADVFYVGDDVHNHSWFTIDERTFTSAELKGEELKVDVEGLHVVIAVRKPS